MSEVESAVASAATTAVEGAAGGSMLPWLLLAFVLAVAGAGIGGYFYGHHVEELVLQKFQSDTEAAADAQVAANKSALLIQQTTDQAKMDAITQTHTEAQDETTKQLTTLLADNSNLTQRLWVATSSSAGKRPGVPIAASAGSGDNATGYAALSIGSGEFFLNEFAQADADAATVSALQQVVLQDRQVCNGAMPGAVPASSASAPH